MGRQIGFFTLDEDDRALLDLWEARGVLAVAAEIATGSVVTPVRPSVMPRRPGGMFYLLPKQVPIEGAVFEEMLDRHRSMLMPNKSAAVEFASCRHEGGTLEEGRIYFATPSSSPWIDHVRRDFDWVSRHLKKWPVTDRFGYHIGPAALAAFRAGQLNLRHLSYELRPAEA